MNTYPTAATGHRATGGIFSWPRRAEAWLDSKGRKAWIAAMVLGFILLGLDRMKFEPRYTDVSQYPLKTAFIIGVFQCLALVPGTSRSGATIMGALVLGFSRKAATEFSFFLAVPTMTGATAYSLYKDRDLLSADDLGGIAIGLGVSFIVALLVVKAFVKIVGRFGFAPFAWYRIVLGAVAILFLSLR